MEATQPTVSNGSEEGAISDCHGEQLIEAAAADGVPSRELCRSVVVSSLENTRQSIPRDKHSHDSSMHPDFSCDSRERVAKPVPGVSNCYVFKSQLQEYAQKVGLPTPVYETIKEGPSHEPTFRSTVIVDGDRYESLPGFFNRKAAEQSAAEVALMEFSKSGYKKDSVAVPVHGTGLCKNWLQEYAQKMNYAVPKYVSRKDDTPGRAQSYSCTIEIGPIQYIGAAAKTKKDAEIKAARTAWLAIRSSGAVGGQHFDGKPQYTVVPGKRKMPEIPPQQVETAKVKKPKNSRSKKKLHRRMQPHDSGCQSQAGILGVMVSNDVCIPPLYQQFINGLAGVQVLNHGQETNYMACSDQYNIPMENNQLNGEASVEDSSGPQVGVDSSQTEVTASSSQADDQGNTSSVESAVPGTDASRNHDVFNIIPMTKAPPSVQLDENNDQDAGLSPL